MNARSKILICTSFLLILAASCRKDSSNLSEIPTLKWKSSKLTTDPQTNQRSIILTTHFTDRDGDIGRLDNTPYDTCNPESYNLQIHYFEKTKGAYTEVFPVDSCLPFNSMLPNITPEGQNKILEGDISITFNYIGLPKNGDVDSVKFQSDD